MSRILENQGKLEFSKMRDVTQMKKIGIDLSTSSNEVVKYWDAILFQSFGFFDAPEVDGIQGCISKIKSLDPYCPLIQTLEIDYASETFDKDLAKLKDDLNAQYSCEITPDRKWTQFEKNYIQASIYKLEGYLDLAGDYAFKQIAKEPRDIMSLKFSSSLMISKGSSQDIATLAGYCSNSIPKSDIYYPFVRAFEAYGLEERGQLTTALRVAEEGLAMRPWNAWATHTLAHIYDAHGTSDKGVEFMESTRHDWAPNNLLSCHNNWHVGLFHLDSGDIDQALNLWDTEIITRLKDQYAFFEMSDAVSLLARIDMEQMTTNKCGGKVNLSSRWDDLMSCIMKSRKWETSMCFYDAHLLLALVGCHKPEMLREQRDNIKEWICKYGNRIFEEWETIAISELYSSGDIKSNKYITKTHILLPLTNAMIFFEDGDYQSAVNILLPIRHNFRILGGSKTQVDVFFQFLASALLMAGGEKNTAMLKMLLYERHDQKVTDNYNDRMQKNIVDFHL